MGTDVDEAEVDARDVIETWELTGDGTAWIMVWSPREKSYVKQKVSSTSGTRRIRLSTEDRRYNEESIVEELSELNPFRNGMLRLTSKDPAGDIDATNHLTETELAELLEIRDMEAFSEAVASIHSELVVRRLKGLAERQGTHEQNEAINLVIDERWRVGGTQRAVQEMIDAGELQGGERLSG